MVGTFLCALPAVVRMHILGFLFDKRASSLYSLTLTSKACAAICKSFLRYQRFDDLLIIIHPDAIHDTTGPMTLGMRTLEYVANSPRDIRLLRYQATVDIHHIKSMSIDMSYVQLGYPLYTSTLMSVAGMLHNLRTLDHLDISKFIWSLQSKNQLESFCFSLGFTNIRNLSISDPTIEEESTERISSAPLLRFNVGFLHMLQTLTVVELCLDVAFEAPDFDETWPSWITHLSLNTSMMVLPPISKNIQWLRLGYLTREAAHTIEIHTGCRYEPPPPIPARRS